MINIPEIIAKELDLNVRNVEATIALLDEGATIPFISRYRKECTGSLNEVQIRDIDVMYRQLQELEKRKVYILGVIESAGALTDELKNKIEETTDPAILEDIYLPYKPKRRTRATIARENGLEPLAKIIMSQKLTDINGPAERYVNDNVADVEQAIAGAQDIIAEWVNETQNARQGIRRRMQRYAVISAKIVKGKEREAAKYRNYDGYKSNVRRCSPHQYMALRRAEREGLLRVKVELDNDEALSYLKGFFIRKGTTGQCADVISDAVEDSYKRLMLPSIENEVAAEWKRSADEVAINLFADNVRQLLMAPPLGNKRVMAIDPGIRTGCKVVCLDAQGNLLHHDVIYPQRERVTSARMVTNMIDKYQVDAIALGNGTGSRETEQFLRVLHMPRPVQIVVVSESGASIYSASEVARREFPDKDVTVRGAVSIGRRLIDPLAELVKIDPKSIGVGQYQHDVDQSMLRDSLDYTVMSCVNSVGVNVNTASPELLSYISGIGPALADNIVAYRAENGDFASRSELRRVPRMGEKAFQQSAGFLRIVNGDSPLDNTSVHPERYDVVMRMASDLGVDLQTLLADKTIVETIDKLRYLSDDLGLPTLDDIISELKQPGRDPRNEVEAFEFDPSITSIEDVKPGMVLNGIVNNITAFGAFVDIGVHESGLVHISQISDKRVNSVSDVLKINQQVRVRVLDVDLDRNRISLSMRDVK